MIRCEIPRRQASVFCFLVLIIFLGLPSFVSAQKTPSATPKPFDLKGLWEDNGHEIRVMQSGNDVRAIYLEPYVCEYRDGSGQSDQTDLDFNATLDGDTLDGEISVCGWGAGNPFGVGIHLSTMTLTVTDDQTLTGTWYNPNEAKDVDMTITRLGECPLVTFTGVNFEGKAVTADKGFISALKKIDDYAGKNKVKVYVTTSFRVDNAPVPGAIVKPAEQSNHLAGHAIDMNVNYKDANGKEQGCDSTCLGGSDMPANVQHFIDDIRKDKGLRWGGDLSPFDPVHIDDGLNLSNPDLWQETHDEVQANKDCDKPSP